MRVTIKPDGIFQHDFLNRFTISISALYRSTKFMLDDEANTKPRIPGYLLGNLAIRYAHPLTNGNLNAFVNIENITIDEEDILFAYCNEELRGKISADIFPLTGENVFSLPDLIDSIRSKIDVESSEMFEEKLRLAGYSDSHGSWYRRNYRIDAIRYCLITDETGVFPLHLASQLPSPVTDVKYSLKTHLISTNKYNHSTFTV
mgnify:CR=1 FL=1